ncbi:MAG TPA: hypothetical protein VGU44_02800 [Gammaproteobacteria bacterium]|nr:hypothetical protein [Gammaproteobacteria bacterium]
MIVPRIRTVKPELFTHEQLFDLEMQYQIPLRIAFIGLLTCCDREGRFYWQPKRLKQTILPYDAVDMAVVLEIFRKHGFIKKYEYQGEFYGYIPSWKRHQMINNREETSGLPIPEQCTEITLEDIPQKAPSIPLKTMSTLPVIDALSSPHGKGRDLPAALETQPPVLLNNISVIFEHWKTVMKHPNAKCDPKRRDMIANALKFGYTTEQLCQAITGCSITPHNCGENNQGQRFDGLHIILGNSEQIDRFMENFENPPRIIGDAERKTRANVGALQQWANTKMAEDNCYANG